jgi:hypothetical protein
MPETYPASMCLPASCLFNLPVIRRVWIHPQGWIRWSCVVAGVSVWRAMQFERVTLETGRNGNCASASGVSGTRCGRSLFMRFAGMVHKSRFTSVAGSMSVASLKRQAVKITHRSMRAASLVSPVEDFQIPGIS